MRQRINLNEMTLKACLIVTLTISAAFAEPIPRFHKVDEHVYRGGQCDEAGFKDLAAMGVKTVIDLRAIGEHSQADEQKIVTGFGMKYVSIPMKGLSTPRDADVAAVLALFNDHAAGPVFVHCRRGADRTGTVVAAYRISHDHWENQKALKEARSLGMSFIECAMMGYVKHYRPSDGAMLASAQ